MSCCQGIDLLWTYIFTKQTVEANESEQDVILRLKYWVIKYGLLQKTNDINVSVHYDF